MLRNCDVGKVGAVAAALLVFVLAGCAAGREGEGKFRSGDLVTVSSGEVVRGDLYATGGTVIVDGTVDGDLTACGGNVTVNGAVGGNLLVCGGQITLNGDVAGDVTAGGGRITVSGPVTGDIRLGAGTALISGPVGEDVVIGAGDVSVQRTATIGGDLIFGAGSANVAGAVSGDIIGQAQTYNRSGTVEGREEVRISPEEEDQRPEGNPTLRWILERLRTLAVLLLLGGFLMWLFPAWLDDLAERILRRPIASLGWGLLTWVGVLFGLLLFTVAWILLAVLFGIVTLGSLVAAIVTTGILVDLAIILALVLSAVFLAWIVVGLAVGRFSLSQLAAGTVANRFLALAVGILLLVLLSSIPYLDSIVTIIVGLGGVGVLGWAVYDLLRRHGHLPPAQPHESAPADSSER